MKQEKRFFSDVWGVQLHFKQVIKQVQKNNYFKAERWRDRVHQSADGQASVKEWVQLLSL